MQTVAMPEAVASLHFIFPHTLSAGARFGKIQAAELVGRDHHGSALVLNQEHDEFRGFGLAGVPPDDVNIRGTFIEGLTSCQSDFLSAPYLHHD